MNDLLSLRELFRHMEWADSLIWNRVLAHDRAATDAALRDRLHHMRLVQHGFLLVWKGVSVRPQNNSFPDTRSVLGWAREYYLDIADYINNLSEQDVACAVDVPWAAMYESQLGRKAAVTSLGETMLQVVMHTEHASSRSGLHQAEGNGCKAAADGFDRLGLGRGKPEAVWPEFAV